MSYTTTYELCKIYNLSCLCYNMISFCLNSCQNLFFNINEPSNIASNTIYESNTPDYQPFTCTPTESCHDQNYNFDT